MLRISLYEQPTGPGQSPHRIRDLRDGIPDRAEAIRIVEELMSPFALKGRNEEQDYWWCRNPEDTRNHILVITPSVPAMGFR